MAVTYVQTDTAQGCTLGVFCSTVAGTVEAGRQAQVGVSAGSSEQTFTVSAGQTDDNEFSFECIVADGTTGSAGDWTVNVNFTTGTMTAIWDSCFICHVNSACSNQATIGNNTSIGFTTNSGSTNTTVTGGAVTLTNGDVIIVTLGFSETGGHSNQTVGITPSVNIVSPFTPPVAGTRRIFVVS